MSAYRLPSRDFKDLVCLVMVEATNLYHKDIIFYSVFCFIMIGCPPETPQSCLACIANYLRTCDAVKTEIMIRFYVAMTVALW